MRRWPITLEVCATSSMASPTRCSSRWCAAPFRPIVKEGLDASASLFTLQGETLAQALAIPVHLGALTPMVGRLLARRAARCDG